MMHYVIYNKILVYIYILIVLFNMYNIVHYILVYIHNKICLASVQKQPYYVSLDFETKETKQQN